MSTSGYLGTILTSHRPVQSLALRVPANYQDRGFDEVSQTKYYSQIGNFIWKNKRLDFTGSLSLNSLHNFSGKILIIESEDDQVVSHQTIMNYLNANSRAQHIIMKNTGHDLSTDQHRQQFIDLLLEWFKTIKISSTDPV